MMRFLSILLFCVSTNAFAQNSEPTDYLPDLISPDELAEEFDLPKSESMLFDGYFQMMSLDDWSSKNGLDISQHFKVVVLVNKANRGTSAQTAKVFFEGKPYKTFKISTGRESMELSPSGKVYRSTTPQGWFSPQRFSPNHFSNTWKAPMPWAVFFNGGVALHATTPSHYSDLGRRASGGCVRFKYDDARELYHLIKNAGRAQVPQFSRSGEIQRDESGSITLQENYDALIIVENHIED